MPTSRRGTLLLMGSGETSASMVEVHKSAMSRVEGAVRAAFLDTPAGFQLNAAGLVDRAVEYFEKHLSTPLARITYPDASAATREETQQAVAAVQAASYLFAGPGSPTYAIRNWQNSPVYDAMVATLLRGGVLAFASAAALTLGRWTIPVYEIYKVGAPVEWVEGLDVLGRAGLEVAVVPHWNNTSGGDHDTRYCFMGQPRWEVLEAQLPPSTTVLGIDEHTACLLYLDENRAEVRGVGAVTLRCGGGEHVFAAGEGFSLDLLCPGSTEGLRSSQPTAAVDGPFPWHALRAQHDALLADPDPDPEAVSGHLYDLLSVLAETREAETWKAHGEVERALQESIVTVLALLDAPAPAGYEVAAPFVDVLVRLRDGMREDKRWADADALRDILDEYGVRLTDSPDGSTWEWAQS